LAGAAKSVAMSNSREENALAGLVALVNSGAVSPLRCAGQDGDSLGPIPDILWSLIDDRIVLD
jgi:hypothetical protein